MAQFKGIRKLSQKQYNKLKNAGTLDAGIVYVTPNKSLKLSTGETAPTTETIGDLGQFYLDTVAKKLYQCVSVTTDESAGTTSYEWQAVGGESIDEELRNNTTQIVGENNSFSAGNSNVNAGYGVGIGYAAKISSNGAFGIAIGNQADVQNGLGIAIGTSSNVRGNRGIAFQQFSYANADYSIQFGKGENNKAHSLQIEKDNIYDAQNHIATFQNLQIDGVDEYPTLSGADAPTTTTVGKVKQFYVETTTPALYYCSSVTGTGTTEDPYVYNWTQACGGGMDILSGTTAPASSTIGKLGQIYIDTAKNCSYVCIQTNNTTYSLWINIGGGGSKLGSGNNNCYMSGSATDVGDDSVNINGYGTASSNSCVNIGYLSGSSSNINRSTAVGYQANYGANDALALGYYSSANANKSIQIGAGTNTTENSLQIFDDNIYKTDTHTLTVQNIELNGTDINTIISNALPTLTSQLTNDSSYITNQVNDLANYYTKTEVDNKIGSKTLLWSGSYGTNNGVVANLPQIKNYDIVLCMGDAWNNMGWAMIFGTPKTMVGFGDNNNYFSGQHNSGSNTGSIKGTSFYVDVEYNSTTNDVIFRTGYDNTAADNQGYLKRIYGINFGG